MNTVEPSQLKVYKRLRNRVESVDPLYAHLSRQIELISAGFGGEKEVERVIRTLNLPDDSYVFTDLHIPMSNNRYLQIDVLVLTPSYFLLLEVKNIRGTIMFEKNPNQLVREVENVREVFRCPEQQVIRHERRLRGLLNAISASGLPEIHPLIVMAYPKTIVLKGPEKVNIINACDLENYVEEINANFSMESQELHRIASIVERKSWPFLMTPLHEKFPLETTDIKIGVFCSECLSPIRKRLRLCPYCSYPVMQSRIDSIADLMLLVRNPVSNADIREFLNIHQHETISYILQHANFRITGKGKGTRYHLR
ncbi:nuclease-related domain-containing protein [Paenisporosarcina cavernae]|uniref:NERD domain-containing protein n=1 Tax=Paenisporosarcina cavernae TaxID=2320858 RepID=A0A385YR12_9BACL|nr:nuclease-related domain-containing protein [Paenisporosarcina cavernae]AYC28934.1 NERD domain-containing protein [Paenisporosarcina cavernae]